MKLFIQNDIRFTSPVDPSSTAQDFQDCADNFADMTAICKKFGVQYTLKLATTLDDIIEFVILTQKCTLDEFNMNELFAEVLFLFDYNIVYAANGGRGCDFAIEMTARKTD